ncbi:twin-arginine translocase TatA/TatE family subunit [Chlorobaculum sp. MV4-Y]|uniref:twin-arginine translocase TatA/TatE family subunit n=1 Tax=Chlorobaculum sp. MV4-Y TaxID=2976335 RepID=UPI0021AF9577|nr:twin-arginine translocase TatA/TatE family subunit [Chlorobaculum sp. MV4-Y]UWX56839.1 twin-arginine translocase TatA/TatE family subunit [Chlorobaculum sp. MV4-Y]
MDVGGPELLLILVVILILFGGQKIPELARGLGKGIKEFKKAQADIESEFHKAVDDVSNTGKQV